MDNGEGKSADVAYVEGMKGATTILSLRRHLFFQIRISIKECAFILFLSSV